MFIKMLEHFTGDAIAYVYMTKFLTISLNLTKFYVAYSEIRQNFAISLGGTPMGGLPWYHCVYQMLSFITNFS